MNLPGIVTVLRREPQQRADQGARPDIRGRIPVHVTPQPSPPDLAKRESQAWNVGRTYEHAYPHVWVYIAEHVSDRLSVQAAHPVADRITNPLIMAMPNGGQNPLPINTTMKVPRQRSYSDQATANPPVAFNMDYAKLI